MQERYEVPVIIYVTASCRDAAFHEVKRIVEEARLNTRNDMFMADIDFKSIKEV